MTEAEDTMWHHVTNIFLFAGAWQNPYYSIMMKTMLSKWLWTGK